MSQSASKTLTFADLEALEDSSGHRYELWNGTPVAMTGGTSAHNLIALGLHRIIRSQLKPGCRVYVTDMALRLNEAEDSNKAYPDVMVVCDSLPGNYQTAPVLLAEVLSDSSVKRDRVDKHRAYTALKSLEAYLILAQTAVMVDVFERVHGWQRAIYQGPEQVIRLSGVELQLPLASVYEDVLSDFGYQ